MTPVSTHELTASANGKSPEVGILDQLRTYVVMMTPSQAKHILETQNWDKQRTLRQSHVAYLSSAIERGELWKLSVEFAELPDGTRRLVDGQHRLNAIVRTGQTMPCVVIVSHLDDERAVARLYASIDRQKSRTIVDALRAYAIVTNSTISLETLAKLSGGVAIISAGFVRDYAARSKSLAARGDDIEAWLPEIETFMEIVRGNSSDMWNLFTRSAVSAVALTTLRACPDRAHEFWSGAARDDGLRKGDPRHTLLGWLRRTPVRSMPHAIEYAQYVAATWNHFYAGTTIEKIVIRDKAAPIRILGTSFTGRARDE